MAATGTPTAELSPAGKKPGFEVRLANFTGPFDLLLGLISKHQLDITDVALSTVTDEFIKYIKRLQNLGEEWALDEASEFLVIAATLLDLKAARLLPAGEVEDEEDIALLEARDLLFARLLQYKAFKQVAGMMGSTLELEGRRYPRQVALEGHFAALLPELLWKHTPQQFAALAGKALQAKDAAPAEIGLAHLHGTPVSVKEQAELLGLRLQRGDPAHLPGADRRRRIHPRRGGTLPCAAGAVPGQGGGLRATAAAGGPDRPLDRRRRVLEQRQPERRI